MPVSPDHLGIGKGSLIMAKKVTGLIRLQIPAGAANPAPPIGPALGSAGCNIMEFCKQFNAATQSQSGMIIPVVITVYQDRSFTFICKSPPAAVLIKKAAGVASAAKKPGSEKAGKITRAQIREIVQIKKDDINVRNSPKIFQRTNGVNTLTLT